MRTPRTSVGRDLQERGGASIRADRRQLRTQDPEMDLEMMSCGNLKERALCRLSKWH